MIGVAAGSAVIAGAAAAPAFTANSHSEAPMANRPMIASRNLFRDLPVGFMFTVSWGVLVRFY
jgi:hypothetical protein